MLSRNVQAEMQQRKVTPWVHMGDLFKSADLVIGNFEGAVGDGSQHPPSGSGSPVFDVARSFVPLLAQAGFTALSVENNHSFDLGDSGKLETINQLQKANINPLFYDNSPRFFRVGDVTISIVAINLVPATTAKNSKFHLSK